MKTNSGPVLPINKVPRIVGKSVIARNIHSLVIGLSGGADSTALLCALASVRESLGIDLTAIHCNFHLRGDESLRDEAFCRQLCRKLNIRLMVFQCPVDVWRQSNVGSDELACREMRYAHFREVMKETGADVIAIAHNSDDQVETFLLNLMRASGTSGLKGMKEFREGIFRPMLGISRKEIEEYLKEIDQVYVTDSTNLESVYRRNFLRNEIIPGLEREWPEARNSILHSAKILERENRIVNWALEKALSESTDSLSRETVSDFPDPESLFRKFLEPFGVSAALVRDISDTISLPYSGRRWTLGNHSTLWETRKGWRIIRDGLEKNPGNQQMEIEKKNFPLTEELMQAIRRAPLSECWTPEGIELEWRLWQKGDRIRPLGMKGSRLVSDILTESHLSQFEKQEIYVLSKPETNEIIWIPDLKRSRDFLIAPDTDSVCRWKVKTS